MTNGEHINFFLMDGSLTGIIKCEIAGWDGTGIKIPRTDLNNTKSYEELNRSGIYFLINKSDDGENDIIYVGQAALRKNGEGLLGRVQEHDKPDEDYWTEAVVFTTKDGLGSTELDYLENQFYALARDAHRYTVKNDKTPNSGIMPDGKKFGPDKFIEYVKLVVNFLGYKVFEKINEAELRIVHGGKEAVGKSTRKGFTVLANSYIGTNISSSLSPGYKALRLGYASKIGKDGKLLEDIDFSSISAAASFVLGRNANGKVTWKPIN